MNKLLVAFALVVSPTAFASTYIYELRGYPADQTSCHQAARRLGDELAAQTGVTVKRAICASATDLGAKLQITYDADAELQPVSTIERNAGINAGGGAFATRSGCDAALPQERERFRTATGLEPFVAYCFKDVYSDDLPFGIRIDAFGAPAQRPYTATPYLFGEPWTPTASEVVAAIKRGLGAAGVNYSYVKYRPLSGYGILTVGYYRTEQLSIKASRVAKLDRPEQCRAALEQTRSAFRENYESKVLVSYCGYDRILTEYSVALVTLGEAPLLISPAVEKFSSHAQCEAARPALAKKYRDDYGRLVAGSTCSREETPPSTTGWRVMLFEERP